jgi:hypothetical protein
VARIDARADEVVVGELKRPTQRREALRLGLDEVRHRHARTVGGHHVLQRVVVCPAQEAHLLAAQSAMACQHIGLHALKREPEMRVAVTNGIAVVT